MPKAPSPPQELGIANPRAARVWIPSHRLWFATSQCNHKQSTIFPIEVAPTPRSLRVIISHKQVLSSSGNPRNLLLPLSRYMFIVKVHRASP